MLRRLFRQGLCRTLAPSGVFNASSPTLVAAYGHPTEPFSCPLSSDFIFAPPIPIPPVAGSTIVGIATDIAVEARLKKATEQVEFCDNNILRMFRTLGIQSLDAPIVGALLKRTPHRRKQGMVQLIMKLREIVTFRERSLQKMQEIEREKEDLLDGAEVEITNKIFADATIDIGFNKMKMTEDIENAIFSLSNNNVVWRHAAIPQDEMEEGESPDLHVDGGVLKQHARGLDHH